MGSPFEFESSVPDLCEIGNDVLVPFVARRLRNPTMLWINRRWFAENGTNAYDEVEAKALELQLLCNFAFCVPQASDPDDAFLEEEREFLADRYGGEGNVFNGGSGRVGAFGRVQIKGIGRTPLSSEDSDYSHAHGGASVEEAIREAVYSRILASEFPHGAVPVIAIIATGTSTEWVTDAGKVYERRALILRPAFVRPALFERALYFRSDQLSHLEDVARVKQAVTWYARIGVERYGKLADIGARIAEQIAFGVAHRLTQGAYSMSNIGLDGALADFGATTALPSWEQYAVVKGSPKSGKEIELLFKGLASIAYYHEKYGEPTRSDVQPFDKVIESASRAYSECLERELLRLCGLPLKFAETEQGRNLLRLLCAYFCAQQQYASDVFLFTPAPKRGWLHNVFFDTHNLQPNSAIEITDAIRSALENIYAAHFPSDSTLGWVTLNRYLLPREALYRQELKQRIETTIVSVGLSGAALRREVECAIEEIEIEGRRHWPALPSNFVVLSQTSAHDTHVLYCEEAATGKRVFLLHGVRVGADYWCLGHRFSIEALQFSGSNELLSNDVLLTEAPQLFWEGAASISVAGIHLVIPPMRIVYQRYPIAAANLKSTQSSDIPPCPNAHSNSAVA